MKFFAKSIKNTKFDIILLKSIFLLITILTGQISLYAFERSNNNIDSVYYQIDSRASFGGGQNTPFWLVSNLYGLGSPKFNNGYVRGKIIKPLLSHKKFSWSIVADLVGAWNQTSTFHIQQLYGEIKYRRLSVSVGSKEYHNEYNDLFLSSGDLLYSGNAMPIPQLRIGTYGFAPFWGTNEWLSVKAYLAFGVFTDSNWQKHWVAQNSRRASGVMYSSRGLWFRIGKKSKFPVTFDLGIEMGSQFGGTIYEGEQKIKMPLKFIDWIKAILPLKGGSDTPTGEQVNVQGNYNGEYNLSLSYSPKPGWDIQVYFEHYFEDQSQMFLQYGAWKDGLWGVKLEIPHNPFISKFVYEYVATKDQSGPVLHEPNPSVPEQISGQDNYFDHYLYGPWQTWGLTIGTPLAISPIYNRSHELLLYDTRFIAHHFGIEGNPFAGLSWRALLTFSSNWGTYIRPLPKKMSNHSGLFEITYHPLWLKKWYTKAAVAWDSGALLGNNIGGMVSIGYNGSFSF